MPPPVDAAAFVAAFARGWESPGPGVWDDLLDTNVVLRQPLLPDLIGRSALNDEYGRLVTLIPDLHGEVLRWAATGDALLIEMRLTGTFGRRPAELTLVDRLLLDDNGRCIARQAYFNPIPLALTLFRHPKIWLSWLQARAPRLTCPVREAPQGSR